MRTALLLLTVLYSIFSFSQDIIGTWKCEEFEFIIKTDEQKIVRRKEKIAKYNHELIMQFTNDGKMIVNGEESGTYSAANNYFINQSSGKKIKYSANKDLFIMSLDPESKDEIDNLSEQYPDIIPNTKIENIMVSIYFKRIPDYLPEESAVPCDPDEKPLVTVEQEPEFIGGSEALYKYISETMEYPEEALQKEISGRVTVRFVIQCDGKISNIEIIRSIDPLLDMEAYRIIKFMPDWIPGKQGGKPVPIYYTMPVTFRLPK